MHRKISCLQAARPLRTASAVSASRQWSIVLHEHDDASFTARVWVDGKLLRPDCVACPKAVAIAYLREALVDARAYDQLSLRAQGRRGIRSTRVTEVARAIRWFEDAELPVQTSGP